MKVTQKLLDDLSKHQRYCGNPIAARPTEVAALGLDAYQKMPLSALSPALKKAPAAMTIVSLEDMGELSGVYAFQNGILGEGICGPVQKATHIASGQLRAIKKIKLEAGSDYYFRGSQTPDQLLNLNQTHKDESKDNSIRAVREVYGLQRIDHPSIVKLHEVFLVGDKKKDEKKTLVLGMEFIDGRELRDEIIAADQLDERQVAQYLLPVAEAVAYLHENNLVHRDIKAENILCQNGTSKLIDLGFTRLVTEDPLSTFCGSPHYAAPEVWKGHKYDGKKSDVWSVGIAMYVAATAVFPFNNSDEICKNALDLAPIKDLSPSFQELVTRMLDKDPKTRPSMKEVLAHLWMQNAKSLRPTPTP